MIAENYCNNYTEKYETRAFITIFYLFYFFILFTKRAVISSQGELSEHLKRLRSTSAYRWFKTRKVKGFYNSVAAPTFRIGVQVLLQVNKKSLHRVLTKILFDFFGNRFGAVTLLQSIQAKQTDGNNIYFMLYTGLSNKF